MSDAYQWDGSRLHKVDGHGKVRFEVVGIFFSNGGVAESPGESSRLRGRSEWPRDSDAIRARFTFRIERESRGESRLNRARIGHSDLS